MPSTDPSRISGRLANDRERPAAGIGWALALGKMIVGPILRTMVSSSKAGDREHYWDTLRAVLMLLGIPYHVALSYRPGQTWIVRSDEGLAVFAWMADIIHYFRMPAFFIIAGYFSALLLARREPGQWFRGRLTRLGVPFVVAILTLVPVMNLACEFSNLAPREALSSFVWNSSHSGGYWVRHLWFIIVLLYLSAAASALMHWRPALRGARLPARIDGAVARRFAFCLFAAAAVIGLWEGAAVELFYIAGLATNFPQQILRLDELIIYTPYFLVGFLLQRAPQTLERLCRFSVPIAIAAPLLVGFSMAVTPLLHPALGRFVATFAAIACSQVLIAGARSFLDRPIPLMQRFTRAAYVIYLFHLPIITVLVWLGQDVPVPVAVKAAGVMLLSLGLSYGAWLVTTKSRLLYFLFNGAGFERPRTAAPTAAADLPGADGDRARAIPLGSAGPNDLESGLIHSEARKAAAREPSA